MTNYNNIPFQCILFDSMIVLMLIENLSHQIINIASEKSIPIINDFYNINLDKNVYTYPYYQIKTTQNQILVYIEIPGVKKENCQLIFKRGILIFKGTSNHSEQFNFVKNKHY